VDPDDDLADAEPPKLVCPKARVPIETAIRWEVIMLPPFISTETNGTE